MYCMLGSMPVSIIKMFFQVTSLTLRSSEADHQQGETDNSLNKNHPRHDHVLCQSLSVFPQTWHKTRSTIVYSPEDVWLFPGWAGSGMHCLPALCLSHSEALQQNGNPGLWHGMAKAQTAQFLEKYLIAIIWTGIAIVIQFSILTWTTVFT